VKFVRFQYDSVAQKKKKILRQVSYPSNLDVTPIVTERLRSIIEQKRRKISEQEDRKKEALLSVSAGGAAAEAPLADEPDEADSLSSPTGMYELVGLVCHKVSTNQLAASFLCLHAYDLGAHGRLRALHWIRKDCGRPLDTVR
jgi:hypothetical protein